jgi:nitroimidazol reductase NimA-like FMN-containing flavoprotein (pyridoxamine 5'-phosphate oxidase superfamily)
MSQPTPPHTPSFRLTDDEIWDFVAGAHTGMMTTLRRDGMPITMPLWFAVDGRLIYTHTRGKKLQRLANDRRANFLVESGDRWAELKAVHFTGTAELVDPAADPELIERLEAATSRKYDAFRTPAADMPATTARAYAATMRWVRFTPDARVLSWDNRKLTGGS